MFRMRNRADSETGGLTASGSDLSRGEQIGWWLVLVLLLVLVGLGIADEANAASGYLSCLVNPGTGIECPNVSKIWTENGHRRPGSWIRGVTGNPAHTWYNWDIQTPVPTQQCTNAVIGTSTCMSGLTYSATSVNFATVPLCESGFEYSGGACVATPTCNAPQVLVGGTCQDCGVGTYYSGGACVAEPTCSSPQVLNPSTHTCEACGLGTYYSGGACVAEPTCSSPQVLNPSTHACESCGAGSYYSGGSCVAEPTCLSPQVVNPATHQCYTPDPTCTPPQVLDSFTHTCYTPIVTCNPPDVLQNGICQACGVGTVYDPNSQSCTSNVVCTGGQVLVNGQCQTPTVTGDCVPSLRTLGGCPAGYAPSSAALGQDLGSYQGAFESLPIQDILYSMGMAVSAMLGVLVGVKLV